MLAETERISGQCLTHYSQKMLVLLTEVSAKNGGIGRHGNFSSLLCLKNPVIL